MAEEIENMNFTQLPNYAKYYGIFQSMLTSVPVNNREYQWRRLLSYDTLCMKSKFNNIEDLLNIINEELKDGDESSVGKDEDDDNSGDEDDKAKKETSYKCGGKLDNSSYSYTRCLRRTDNN